MHDWEKPHATAARDTLVTKANVPDTIRRDIHTSRLGLHTSHFLYGAVMVSHAELCN
jgi:hypothetical protein